MRFPIFQQLDAMDCGPTCLRMVAAHHGRLFPKELLRDLCEIGKGGVSLLGISQAAERIGLRSLAVKLPFKTLRDEVPLPCIAHWDQQHFIVIHKITGKAVHVADPGRGPMVYTHAEFMEGWLPKGKEQPDENTEGILLLLETTPQFADAFAGESDQAEAGTFGFLWRYVAPHRRLFVQLGIGFMVALVLDLIFPFLTQAVVDAGINNLDLGLIHLLLAGQLMLSLSGTILDMIESWIMLHIGSRTSLSLISDFLHKLLKLPLSFFDTRTAGDIMQRVEDHERINKFLTGSSLQVVFSLFSFIVFGAILAIYNIGILLLFLGMTLLTVGWLVIFLKRRRILDQKRFDLNSQERDKFVEMVSGVQEIKLQGLERPKRWEWEELSVRKFKLSSRVLALKQSQRIGTSLLGQVRNILITYLAARAVIRGEMTLGMMLSTQYMVGQLSSPVSKLIDFMYDAQDARLSLERMGDIYRQREEEHFVEPKSTNFPQYRSLILHDVTFKYPGAGREPALSHLSIFIPEGRVTAIVGSSGSGKTTLLKLLVGLHPTTSGTIYLERTPLTVFDMQAWRARCGVVMQDGYVFSDTLAANIACTGTTADPIRLETAVRLARLQEFISSLPMGLQTRVGKDGRGLSGGQKQRLLIARAIYKSPDYLFLDEATSALDAGNEHAIMDNLRQIFPGRTVVIVAHRLSTVKDADQIIVLERGRVVEVGNHHELVRKQGWYYNLVRNQLELEAPSYA